MIQFEEEIQESILLSIAHNMAIAARTAPKGHGKDHLSIAVAGGETLQQLSDCMVKISSETGHKFLLRDAENLMHARAVLLVGTTISSLGMDCGYCGFPTCEEKNKHENVPCFFNAHDLGVAVGSAVSLAADCRVDNRVMFSVGLAAARLNLLPEAKVIFGIPLAASGKNKFFDRKPIQARNE